MSTSLFRLSCTAGLLAASTLVAQAAIERSVEKTFNVAAAGTLRIETQGGGIKVSPGADGAVRVVAKQKIRADSEAEADELLKKLELTFEQSGNDVTAISKYEKRSGGFFMGSWPPVTVEFVVTVPASFATQLHTSGGSITVGDLNGKVVARTSGGSITLGQMGGTVDARTSGGNVGLAGATGEVELKTSGGNITAGKVSGSADLATSGGSIKIESASGRVRAHTSGGSVRAKLAGALTADSELSTSGGSVTATVDKTASFRLDASTSGGSVDADGLTITLEGSNKSRSRLAGAVNGGGPVLKLRSSGGNVSIRAN
jgi:hypothetical protein